MTRLFKHACRVTVARQPTGFIAENPQFFETFGNATEVEVGLGDDEEAEKKGLRVEFTVKRTLTKEPNTCEITIYNLAPSTRADFEKKPATVTLHAGYDRVPRLLFTGDLRKAWSEKDGTLWKTYIRVGDGARAYAHARISRSYKPPIQVRKVLQDAANSMGLDLPPEIEQSVELKQSLSSGISLHGPTRDVLTRLLAPYGYGWSVQNGTLQIVRDGDTRGEAFLINADTGLKNSPTRETSDKALERLELNMDVALFPELFPSGLIKLESDAFEGTFRMLEVTHTGDSAGDEWNSKVKARAV